MRLEGEDANRFTDYDYEDDYTQLAPVPSPLLAPFPPANRSAPRLIPNPL